MTTRDYKFLLNNKTEMSKKELKSLLLEQECFDDDPVLEAFKVYDPNGTGYVDMDILRHIFEQMGFGKLSADDMMVLIGSCDHDDDGKISLEDFRTLLFPTTREESHNA